MEQNNDKVLDKVLFPILPLRDVVVYPHMVIPLFVGREKSIKALQVAMEGDKQIMLVAQKNATVDDPNPDDIYSSGTLSTVLQLLRLPDGTVKVLVEGVKRATILEVFETDDFYSAHIAMLEGTLAEGENTEVLCRSLLGQFEQYVKLNNSLPAELLTSLASIEDPSRLVDSIAAHMVLKIEARQEVLEIEDIAVRLERLMVLLESEIDLLQVEKRIRGRVKNQMEKSQREYYLNEQMKAIQKELGEMDDVPNEIEEISLKIEKAGMPKETKKKVVAELGKLKMMSPMSAESTVVRNYIDWMVGLPWKKRSKVKHDLDEAMQTLDDDHYGLDKVKERILEYLAVQQRVKKLKGPILCLVGPPGVGKTTLGHSIAKATGRKFVRMSLGGVRDEAEIRGHRRTYIGAMPGKIIQSLSKVKANNPLFLLDEVDKMAMDSRGDPASALLEVLDPEQNHTFNDHYLEADYDLSEIMFVATANSLNIPSPLLDRMEVIRLSGYTEDEKLNIAIRYIIPKQMKNNGLKKEEASISEGAVWDIIRYYTREAGVRSLEREISKICRKVVKAILLNKSKGKKVSVGTRHLEKYLGVRRFRYGIAEEQAQVGQVTGLAWTEVGGDLLVIEAAKVPGKGRLNITGQLGEVMQESIQAAMTVVRHRAARLGIQPDFYQKHDIHIHVPEGAIPKDGPSAGIGMCVALVSVLTGIPVKSNLAMTGEITLRGKVLPIGGLKEKLLAAHRGGIQKVLIPEENVRDLAEIPENIKHNLDIQPVQWIDEVLAAALVEAPQALSKKEIEDALLNNRVSDSVAGTEIRPH
ncbi:MAG: endopeptidase La [Gammaproteobacteria bacterium]|nr:endopeptidase La [Gammaproteobacteria bacterium]